LVIAPWLRGLKAYAPDNNQAIRYLISAHPYLFNNTPAIFEPIVGTSTNQVDDAYRLENPSSNLSDFLRHSFIRRPTDTMPT
jgi:hypothetical protein